MFYVITDLNRTQTCAVTNFAIYEKREQFYHESACNPPKRKTDWCDQEALCLIKRTPIGFSSFLLKPFTLLGMRNRIASRLKHYTKLYESDRHEGQIYSKSYAWNLLSRRSQKSSQTSHRLAWTRTARQAGWGSSRTQKSQQPSTPLLFFYALLGAGWSPGVNRRHDASNANYMWNIPLMRHNRNTTVIVLGDAEYCALQDLLQNLTCVTFVFGTRNDIASQARLLAMAVKPGKRPFLCFGKKLSLQWGKTETRTPRVAISLSMICNAHRNSNSSEGGAV